MRNEMKNSHYKTNPFEKLFNVVYGWDKCHLPVKDIFRHDDKPENCPACGGIGSKRSMEISDNLQRLSCIECGLNFVRPVMFGVIITAEEIEI